MKKVSEIILLVMLIIWFFVSLIIGCFHTVKHTNIKRYNETPIISEIEERTKKYILDVWLKSGVELEFITQELIDKNTLVYYFKVVEPGYFHVFGVDTYYVKAVYEFQNTYMPAYRYWKFDRVMTSYYSEIEALLEVEDER